LLRRQVLRTIRKPLIVMTPKSLLRHPKVISPVSEFSSGSWLRIIPDRVIAPEQARHVLFCSGKVYYDLEARRDQLKAADTAIVRVEQLYPLEMEHVHAALAPYAPDIPVTWVQEEPENMGAWRHFRFHFGDALARTRPVGCVTRPASASPATGSANSHKIEQEQILTAAFQKPAGTASEGTDRY
jgi:2-oxoglutarate dehydrogenase E1 component